jgi:hypothetical protein
MNQCAQFFFKYEKTFFGFNMHVSCVTQCSDQASCCIPTPVSLGMKWQGHYSNCSPLHPSTSRPRLALGSRASVLPFAYSYIHICGAVK